MNRPILIVVGTVAITLVLTPWVFGALAQQRVEASVARLDAEDDIVASVVDYARGWTSSTATIEVATLDSAVEDTDIPPELGALIARLSSTPMRLIVTMRHGPVLLGEGVAIGLAASTIHPDPHYPQYREFLDSTGIEHLFEIRTLIGLDGQSDFVAAMPAFEFDNLDVDVEFSGATASGTYDPASRRLQARGRTDDLRATSDQTTLTIESVTFDSDSTWYSPLLRLGFAEASVGRIAVDAPLEQFVLDDVTARFDLNLAEGGEHATMSSVYTLGRYSDGAETNLDDVAVTATARRVDIDALTAYYDASQRAAMQDSAAAPLALDAEDALYDLLGSSPEIEIAPIRFAWNDEPLDATLRISASAERLPPRTSFTLLALAFQGIVEVDATLAVSEALAASLAARGLAFQIRRAAAQSAQTMTDDEVEALAAAQASITLASLVAQGMLTRTDDGYETTARFAEGALTVNGNAVPLGLR